MKRFSWYIGLYLMIAATWTMAMYSDGVWGGWLLATALHIGLSAMLESDNRLN